MTSMLDIVFIMLIFFIVTASFVSEKGLQMNFPGKPPAGPPSPNEPIGFQVDANNHIFHAGRLIDPWSIEPIIKREHTERPEAPVVVSTHKDAHTRQFIRIYDEALKAGMGRDRIAVVVSSE
ncbi:MAG: biopolymer transporter ExbD [Alphaproteobacteria bacterium]|nr:biopolymer transporter ExbD [Alphaproteobacteria bacterium]